MKPVKKQTQTTIDYTLHKLGCKHIGNQVRDQVSARMSEYIWYLVWDQARYETSAKVLQQR